MNNLLATMCYIDNGDSYLMLKRNKKENDIHEGLTISVGGKFEIGEKGRVTANISSTIFVISKGYLNSRKVRSAFILIALPSMGFNLFYYNSFKREVETSTLSKVVDAKVITEANFSSNYRLVLLSDGDILTVDDARNIRDFKIGDKVTSIDNVKETIHLTDIFGKERTGVSEYVLLKGKE